MTCLGLGASTSVKPEEPSEIAPPSTPARCCPSLPEASPPPALVSWIANPSCSFAGGVLGTRAPALLKPSCGSVDRSDRNVPTDSKSPPLACPGLLLKSRADAPHPGGLSAGGTPPGLARASGEEVASREGGTCTQLFAVEEEKPPADPPPLALLRVGGL